MRVRWVPGRNPSHTVIVLLTAAALLVATACALLFGSRLARTAALVLVAVNIAGAWYRWYPISMLVRTAIRALMMSTPGTADLDTYLVTQYDFVSLFVDPVPMIGPWMLIALYAHKLPMRGPPDDGTPFPRRFCGNCYYNLHGIADRRCPECGTPMK